MARTLAAAGARGSRFRVVTLTGANPCRHFISSSSKAAASSRSASSWPALTSATCRVLDVEPASVDIIIQDVKRENWATAGTLWSDKKS